MVYGGVYWARGQICESCKICEQNSNFFSSFSASNLFGLFCSVWAWFPSINLWHAIEWMATAGEARTMIYNRVDQIYVRYLSLYHIWFTISSTVVQAAATVCSPLPIQIPKGCAKCVNDDHHLSLFPLELVLVFSGGLVN